MAFPPQMGGNSTTRTGMAGRPAVGDVHGGKLSQRNEEGGVTWAPDWLSRELKARGWRLNQFARLAGVSRAHTHRIAHGQARPSATICKRIAAALGLEELEVMRRYGILPQLPDAPDERDLAEMAEIFARLRPEQRRLALALVRFAEGWEG